MTVATCVCWSMNSETRTAYGSRIRRQGRSRPCRRYQLNRRRRNLADWKATDAHRLTRIFRTGLLNSLICVSSVLICGVNDLIHARADATGSGKASRFARGVRVRVRAEGVDNFFCAEEQAER